MTSVLLGFSFVVAEVPTDSCCAFRGLLTEAGAPTRGRGSPKRFPFNAPFIPPVSRTAQAKTFLEARVASGAGSGREDRCWALSTPWLHAPWAPSRALLLALLDSKMGENSTYFTRWL